MTVSSWEGVNVGELDLQLDGKIDGDSVTIIDEDSDGNGEGW